MSRLRRRVKLGKMDNLEVKTGGKSMPVMGVLGVASANIHGFYN
jgi:hypothetical protein